MKTRLVRIIIPLLVCQLLLANAEAQTPQPAGAVRLSNSGDGTAKISNLSNQPTRMRHASEVVEPEAQTTEAIEAVANGYSGAVGYAMTDPFSMRAYLDKAIGGGVGYDNGYTNLGLFKPFHIDPNFSLLFIDSRALMTDDGRGGFNVGIGYRVYMPEMDRIIGISGWYDYDDGHAQTYQQAGVSLESLGRYLDARFNAYLPVSDSSITQSSAIGNDPFFRRNNIIFNRTRMIETAYKGVDAEVGGPLPLLGRYGFRGYLGAYYLDGNGDQDAGGFKGRIEADITSDWTMSLTVSDDRTFGTNVFANVILSIPDGRPNQWFRPVSVQKRLAQSVRRNFRVVTHTQFKDDDVLAINPADGAPFRVAHIDPDAAAGDGTFSFESPAESTAAFANNSAFDIIFVNGRTDGTDTNLDTTIGLFNNQRLLGSTVEHDFTSVRGTFTLPGMTGGLMPILSNAGAPGMDVVSLENSNEVSGFTIDATDTGRGIVGAGDDGFNINRNTFVNYTQALRLTNAAGTIAGGNPGIVVSNVFSGNAGTALYGFNLTNAGAGDLDLLFANNIVSGNDLAGAQIWVGAGDRINTAIVSNTFSDNEGDGLVFNANSSAAINGSITDNVIDGNGGDAIQVIVDDAMVDFGTVGSGLTFTEDMDGDGILNPGEDLDGDGEIDVFLGQEIRNNTFINNGGGGLIVNSTNDSDVNLTLIRNFIGDPTNRPSGNGSYGVSLMADSGTATIRIGGPNINEDKNGNGILDDGEDIDLDGILDFTEDANHNGILDAGEDLNGDGILTVNEDINLNGILDPSEDTNGNGVLDAGEDTNGNGNLDLGEEDLNGDGLLTVSEDTNGNGVLDAGEDLNGNGEIDLFSNVVATNFIVDNDDGGVNIDLTGTAEATLLLENNIVSDLFGGSADFMLDGNTFDDSFFLTNLDGSGEEILTFTLDVSALGLEFDADPATGIVDPVTGDPFIAVAPTGTDTGLITPTIIDGDTSMVLTFTDFQEDETLEFRVDIDPTTGNGAVFGNDLIDGTNPEDAGFVPTVVIDYVGGQQQQGRMVPIPGNLDASRFEPLSLSGNVRNNNGVTISLADASVLHASTIVNNNLRDNGQNGIFIEASGSSVIEELSINNNKLESSGSASFNDVGDLTGSGIVVRSLDTASITASVTENVMDSSSATSNFSAYADGGTITLTALDDNVLAGAGLDALRFETANDGVIDIATIQNNTLDNNIGNGISIIADSGTISLGLVDMNTINRDQSGTASVFFDTLNADISGIISNNSMVGDPTANTDTSFGIGGTVNGGLLNLTIDSNEIDNNVDVGIGFILQGGGTPGSPAPAPDPLVATLVIINNEISQTTDDATTTDFNGEGISISVADTDARLTNSVINNNTIGDLNIPGQGNAGDGIFIHLENLAEIEDLEILDNDIANNLGHGINFERIDNGVLTATSAFLSDGVTARTRAITIGTSNPAASRPVIGLQQVSNVIQDNGLNGINLMAENGAFLPDGITLNTQDFMVQNNLIQTNLEDGIKLLGEADAQLVVDINDNLILNNGDGTSLDGLGDNGIETEVDFVNLSGDLVAISGTWTGNTISDNSDFGISFNGRSLPAPTMPLPVINLGDGTEDGRNIIENNGAGGILSRNPGNVINADTNTIANNQGHGIDIEVLVSQSFDGSFTNNLITRNTGDGVEILTSGSGSGYGFFGFFDPVIFDNNEITYNDGRGIDLLVRGRGVVEIALDNNDISSNGEEGVYVVTTASLTQSQDVSSRTNLATDGSATFVGASSSEYFLTMRVAGNTIDANGQISRDQNYGGLSMRIGTSQFGFVETEIRDNSLRGNWGDDIVLESFTSTVDPRTNSATIFDPDPLARLDIVAFQGNKGDSLSVTRGELNGNGFGTAPGAYYTNADIFKSPNPPFTSTARRRNAQRVSEGFGNPLGDGIQTVGLANGSGTPGTGLSSFRVEGTFDQSMFTDDVTSGFITDIINPGPSPDELSINFGGGQLGVTINEFPFSFAWDRYTIAAPGVVFP